MPSSFISESILTSTSSSSGFRNGLATKPFNLSIKLISSIGSTSKKTTTPYLKRTETPELPTLNVSGIDANKLVVSSVFVSILSPRYKALTFTISLLVIGNDLTVPINLFFIVNDQ